MEDFVFYLLVIGVPLVLVVKGWLLIRVAKKKIDEDAANNPED